ncbi:response regulator transcription factor [Serratia sp. AKBS12]|uniref:response regulator transcription factor n=1 Tax=Serratia sp. AKBS12 TaxID=2974597 RepID=UPI0021658B10|nr:LuxR C-terminal-related transcriptional regulator [Serratia sp. AKBS12]MCS3405860.1 LuxR C-terminal-related transcriptional regulator [Serratia sp. AKBS12]
MGIQVEKLASLIDAATTRHFYPQLLDYLERFFAFDHALIYAFESQRAPCCLYKAEKENSDAINALYQQGAYLQDPFYRALNDNAQSELFTLRQLAPCGFYHSEYYRNFYRKTGWRDEAGVLLQLTPQRRLGVFFGSSQQTVGVRQSSAAELPEALVLARSVVRLHAASMADKLPADVAPNPLACAGQTLTAREREIVDLILAGLGSRQIAARLFISLGTVKNHRKNIYSKLGIGSQAALFNLFLATASPSRR